MAVRRTNKEVLLRRLRLLEVRVGRLERRRTRPRVAPGPAGPTCPGCSLVLPKARRTGRCVWCGFRLDAVAPRAPQRPRSR